MKSVKQKLEPSLKTVGDMALKRRALKIIQELDLKNGDNILDIGCGPGFYIDLIQKIRLNLKITGADIDIDALDFAKKKYKDKNIKIVYGDLMKILPFKDNTFDKIILSEVCEHLPDDLKGLKEVYRVLKKGGILIVTIPNKNYPLLWDPVNWVLDRTTKKHIKTGVWAGIWTNHIRLYTPQEITSRIKKAHFKIQKTESITWWSLPFNHNILYGGKFSKTTSKKINQYITNRPFSIKLLFQLINLNDKINDLISLKNIGVCVIIKAIK